MPGRRFLPALLLLIWLGGACSADPGPAGPTPASEAGPGGWTEAEVRAIRALWLGSLPELPPDPSNSVAGDGRAAALGQGLFFDTRLSANGEVACATCHQPERYFTDGLALAEAIGTTSRGTPTIVGVAYSPWFFWDGRRDSQWAQALTPLESPIEHGGTRVQYARLVANDPDYRRAYEALFGPVPDLSDRGRFPEPASPSGEPAAQAAWETMAPADQQAVSAVYANLGKAIAAYERLIQPGPSPFDDYAAALVEGDEGAMAAALTEDQVAGLKLFIGRANCTRCHNGPLFTSNSFHNIGLPETGGDPDPGRFTGVQQALNDEFNCLGSFSDAGPDGCAELRFAKTNAQELFGAFKVPTLRNVGETAPYMHTGQLATLAEVVAHYNAAPPSTIGHSDLVALGFTDEEQRQLVAFLESLTGPLAAGEELLRPPGG
jgi:cytochrome c peroxidase